MSAGTCVARRVWRKLDRTPDGCWVWTGGDNGDGYGRVHLGTRNQFAYPHRLMYELLVGPIPEGHDIDHLCRTHGCCNPDHLEPVTRRENLMRGETLTAAHHAGIDCGFERCTACQRHRLPNAQEATL